MAEVKVNQTLDVHAQMAILGQYQEQGIRLWLTDASGQGKEIGKVVGLVPMKDSFNLKVEFNRGMRPLRGKQLDNFVFSNFYGRYIVSRPEGT